MLENFQSMFLCIFKALLSYIPGKVDQFIPGQLFESFQASYRSKSSGYMFRNSNQVVFLELLMSPGKDPQIGLKVQFCVWVCWGFFSRCF